MPPLQQKLGDQHVSISVVAEPIWGQQVRRLSGLRYACVLGLLISGLLVRAPREGHLNAPTAAAFHESTRYRLQLNGPSGQHNTLEKSGWPK